MFVSADKHISGGHLIDVSLVRSFTVSNNSSLSQLLPVLETFTSMLDAVQKQREGSSWCGTTGEDCADGPGAASRPDDHFEWCGGRYCRTDLADAVAVLQIAYCDLGRCNSRPASHECSGNASLPSFNHLSQEWDESQAEECHQSQQTEEASQTQGHLMHSIWSPEAWRALGREAQTLLTSLKLADHIPWVQCCAVLCCAVLCCAVGAVLCCWCCARCAKFL